MALKQAEKRQQQGRVSADRKRPAALLAAVLATVIAVSVLSGQFPQDVDYAEMYGEFTARVTPRDAVPVALPPFSLDPLEAPAPVPLPRGLFIPQLPRDFTLPGQP